LNVVGSSIAFLPLPFFFNRGMLIIPAT